MAGAGLMEAAGVLGCMGPMGAVGRMGWKLEGTAGPAEDGSCAGLRDDGGTTDGVLGGMMDGAEGLCG